MLRIGSNINEVRIDGDLNALRRDLDFFKGIGLTAAEIPVHGLDAIKNGRLDRKVVYEVRRVLEEYDLSYSVHAPNPLNLMDTSDLELHAAVLEASLEFCGEIGSGVLVYHPGRFLAEEAFATGSQPELTDSRKKQLLSQEAVVLQNVAGRYPKVLICMENARPYRVHSPYCYAEIPKDLKQQVRRIDRDNVRVTLDFGHLWMASKFYGFDPVAETANLSGLISHCHLHDNFGGVVYASEKQQTHQIPFGRGDSHMPVGWGNIPFAELFETFLDGFEGLLITELRSRYFGQTGESADSLAVLVAEASGCKRQVFVVENG